MSIDEKAEDIARLVIAQRFECARGKWKEHTTGMTARDIVRLRERIEVIEGRIISGFDEVKNSNTGDL